MRRHSDVRRDGYFDLFPDDVVEVNAVVIHDSQSAGDWHGHRWQDDYWFVPLGKLRVGMKFAGERRCRFLTPEHDPLHIPAGWWHTYKALEPTVLIYGLTRRYDEADPDERRLEFSTQEEGLYG
ncbi:MAG: hypothetical protein GWN53_17170 [Gammaproteobacteria bacterium]|uniref:Cupin domain-containing protein n=1 Tax=Candidatus Kutchimonas denitrificans TaxID=3056748 RepID=A0AAE4ZCH9_9BACT|nr:hypothetical protein [Candidatus Kutchimonas denitrificans]NIV53573.1 hypothetical protein [Gammaproteobacteria bacterium]